MQFILLQVTVTGNFPDGSRTPTVESSLVTPAAPMIQSATADTPSTAVVGISPPTSGPLPAVYTVTLTPVGGGPPITVTSASPIVDFSGLAPGTMYTATAVATLPDGTKVPVAGTATLATPVGPALTTASATGPTAGQVTIEPPSGGTQPSSYTVTLTPVGGGSPITVTCTNPLDCPIPGLTPDTTYSVSAVGNLPGGGTTAATGTSSLTTPADLPGIASALATGATTGMVVITPPTGPQPTNYTVTFTPIGGGNPITIVCSTPASCPVTGLAPDTAYLVWKCLACAWRFLRVS